MPLWSANNTTKVLEIDFFVVITRQSYVSRAYLLLLTLFSDPSLSFEPQWKWNWARMYFPTKGPPERMGVSVEFSVTFTKIQKNKRLSCNLIATLTQTHSLITLISTRNRVNILQIRIKRCLLYRFWLISWTNLFGRCKSRWFSLDKSGDFSVAATRAGLRLHFYYPKIPQLTLLFVFFSFFCMI